MKKSLLTILVTLVFASCATTSNVNSTYQKKEYAQKNKAVIIGGIIANVTSKDPNTGTIGNSLSQSVGIFTSLFKSNKTQEKELREKEGTVMKGKSELLFVKPQNLNKKDKYFDYKVGGLESNKLDKISMLMVDPGKYILKGYRFDGASIHVGKTGYDTNEFIENKYNKVKNVSIDLAQGDVLYIGNFEINEKDEKHTLTTLNKSTELRKYLAKKYPELAKKMKVKILKLKRVDKKIKK